VRKCAERRFKAEHDRGSSKGLTRAYRGCLRRGRAQEVFGVGPDSGETVLGGEGKVSTQATCSWKRQDHGFPSKSVVKRDDKEGRGRLTLTTVATKEVKVRSKEDGQAQIYLVVRRQGETFDEAEAAPPRSFEMYRKSQEEDVPNNFLRLQRGRWTKQTLLITEMG